MSKTASPSSIALATGQVFQKPETVGRVLWCKSALMNVYVCAQQQVPASLDDLQRWSAREIDEQRWKIAMIRIYSFDSAGRPTDPKHMNYMKFFIDTTLAGQPYKKHTDVLTYTEMMGIMQQYYSPSALDPMKRLPNHISNELRVWQRAKEEAELKAREEYMERHIAPK